MVWLSPSQTVRECYLQILELYLDLLNVTMDCFLLDMPFSFGNQLPEGRQLSRTDSNLKLLVNLVRAPDQLC